MRAKKATLDVNGKSATKRTANLKRPDQTRVWTRVLSHVAR